MSQFLALVALPYMSRVMSVITLGLRRNFPPGQIVSGIQECFCNFSLSIIKGSLGDWERNFQLCEWVVLDDP